MIQYIYFVKCPNCEDEHFDFFDDAKGFALGCLSKKPIITQTEVCRNDFGECTDSSDLGTVWSWEDECADCTEVDKAPEPFNRGDFTKYADGYNPDTDPEFADDDSDFRFINELEEGISNGVTFRNSEDFAEFKKLCDEIGIITIGDLNNFMKENDATDANILDKLREYRAELGPDFKIKEAYTDPETECIYNDNIECTNDGDCAECSNNPKAVLRKPVPEGMTIEQLVEEMEKNEDNVECSLCNELAAKTECHYDEDEGYICPDCLEHSVKCSWCGMYFDRSECRHEVDLGWLCDRCEAAIKSRGETLTFIENDYWDFLDEETDLRDPFDHHDPDYDEDEAADYLADRIDRAHDERYDDAIDDFFNEDFGDPVDFDEEEDQEESLFAAAESVEDVVDILVKDEEEAVVAYEEAAEKIEELASEEETEEAKEVLDHIKEEEVEHIEELKELRPESADEEADLTEAVKANFDPREKVELEYTDLTVTVYGRQRDVDDWDEWEQTGDYTYEVDKQDAAETIWDFMTDEDAADIPGGLETLEDNDEWEKFLEVHFDDLFEKYYDKLLDYYEDDAKYEASRDENFLDN